MTTITSAGNLAASLQKLQAGLSKADADGNGSLSQAEFTAATKTDAGLTGGQSAAAEFKKLDTDGNGQITKTELTAGINLNTQVQAALLQGQELAGGSAFLQLLSAETSTGGSLFSSGSNLTSSLLGGGSSDDTLTSLLSGGNANTSALAGLFGTKLDGNTQSLLQQIIDKYNAAATAPESPKPTDTTA